MYNLVSQRLTAKALTLLTQNVKKSASASKHSKKMTPAGGSWFSTDHKNKTSTYPQRQSAFDFGTFEDELDQPNEEPDVVIENDEEESHNEVEPECGGEDEEEPLAKGGKAKVGKKAKGGKKVESGKVEGEDAAVRRLLRSARVKASDEPSTLVVDPDLSALEYFGTAVDYLKGCDLGNAWQALINKFCNFEEQMGVGKIGKVRSAAPRSVA